MYHDFTRVPVLQLRPQLPRCVSCALTVEAVMYMTEFPLIRRGSGFSST